MRAASASVQSAAGQTVRPWSERTAALIVEELVAPVEGVEELLQGADFVIGLLAEELDPLAEADGEIDLQGAVGAEGGEDFGGALAGGEGAMVAEVVGRVVGGAEGAGR